MKYLKTTVYCALAALAAGCATQQTDRTKVEWETLGNQDGQYIQRLTITGNTDFDRIGFNMFKRDMTPLSDTDTITELFPGYYALSSSRFVPGADTIVVDIATRGAMRAQSYAPDGFHCIMADGTTRPVEFVRHSISEPDQWRTPDGDDRMPYGEAIYDQNEALKGGNAGVYDVIPSYKSVTLIEGTSKLPLKRSVTIKPTERNEAYTMTVRNDSLIVEASDQRTADMAMRSFDALVLGNNPQSLPNAVIEDWPDYEYRGLMIDIVRNYQTPETMKRIVDYMAQYRMNRLHMHIIDDEACRIEIPTLPELTSYAGRRGYSTDESEYLLQAYSGDGDPNSKAGVSNGYFTRDEYIDFIRYAYDRGICVIPEVESPGHARAAIKAMEKRYRDTGDDTYRLIQDNDTSAYTSAQAYHDNVMNPALEGPYRFMGVMFDELQSMYRDANVPLLAIHIGGDEVARGAWEGSDKAQALIAEKGLDGQTGLHGYFVDSISAMMTERGIPMSGWQEIAVGHTDQYNQEMSPITYSVNCWTQSNNDPQKSITARALTAGFPVVASNVNHFYMDMMYNAHPEEPGLNWGGYVDEFQSLHGYPRQLSPVDPDVTAGKLLGVSGHLFSETIRSPQMLELYLFPKMLGLVERSWNGEPTYNDADYNAVIATKEIPRWTAEGRNWHLRQPGIKVIDGQIYMNSPYEGSKIYYTTDGSMPDTNSKEYNGPISADGVSEVRAILTHEGKQSLVTYLFI